MAEEKTSSGRELLARKKLHEIAAKNIKKMSEKKRDFRCKGAAEIYTACNLQRFCTLDNFHKIYRGNIKIPAWRIIWALRKIVNPAEWFFYEDEKPRKKDLADITPATLPDFRKSVNFARIKEKANVRGRNADTADWCRKIGIKYITFYMIQSEQRAITPGFVFKMRKVFPPRLWFEKEKPHDNDNHSDSE